MNKDHNKRGDYYIRRYERNARISCVAVIAVAINLIIILLYYIFSI